MLGIVLGILLALPAWAESTQVRGLRVSEAAGDTTVVISASGRPTFTTWKLEQPARVVVDLSGARLGNVDVPMDAGTYAVGLISANASEDESGPRTRVVLTLRQPSDYRVETRGHDIVVRVIPQVRPAAATDSSESRAKAEAQTERALAQAKAEAEARAAAQDKADQALAQVKAETQAKTEAQKERAAAQVKADQALAQVKAETQAKTEAQKERAAAQVKADQALAQAKAEEKAKTEAQKERAAAQVMADQALAQVRAEEQAKKEAQVRARTQAQVAAQAHAENAKLKQELEQARRDTAQAQAAAAAASAENERHRLALARSEQKARKAEQEAELTRRRAEAAETSSRAAEQRETERGQALRKAAREVELRTAALEAKAKSQEEQQRRLEQAERLVAERETKVHASARELGEREQAAQAALAKRAELEHKGASSPERVRAAQDAAKAEQDRKNAERAAVLSRKELKEAMAARVAEEGRRQSEARGRQEEEERLKRAEAARAAEEVRLTQARADRARVEGERVKLESERAQLEITRDALAAEVKRLRESSTAAKASLPTSKPAVNLAATAAPATAPVVARETASGGQAGADRSLKGPSQDSLLDRPRSVTLRASSRVRRIDFVDEPTRSSVIIDLESPSGFEVERTSTRRVSLRLEHADLPDDLARRLDATEYLGPVRLISSYRDPRGHGVVRVDVDLAEDVPNRVRQEGNRLYWDFNKSIAAPEQRLPALSRPSSPFVVFMPGRRVAAYSVRLASVLTLAQAAAAPRKPEDNPESPQARRASLTAKKRYVGRRIDLDFKGADIHNILRLLADVGQINIVTADDVKGEVTIKMRDVPWDQALDVVLRAKGLGSVREGNLVRVAPLSFLEKELEQEIARQKQMAEILPTETRLIGVSYAHANELQDKAKDLLSPRGKISVDERTNNLIVSDVARNLQLIEDLVRNLDTQTSQVVIEARIVEANSDYSRQMGIQWGGNTFMDVAHGNPTGLTFPYNIGIGGGADDGSSPTGGLVPGVRTGVPGGTSPNFVVNMPVAAGQNTGAALGITLGSVAGAFNLNLRLSAMESTGQVRILSSPRITTLDNINATIEQGVSIPVSVVSAMGAQTQFVDAKIHLGVKPHVTNEGTIMLTIDVTKNEPDFVNTGSRGDPTILKKQAKTTMLIRDGDTAVIGGIYTRNSGLSFAKVPFFSDIPVLGWFFRNRRENDHRTEFLVFLTPRIVNRARSLGQ